MRLTATYAAAFWLALNGIVGAHADPRDDLATELRDEISTRRVTCDTEYGVRDVCRHRNGCNETLQAISDFRIDLAIPDAHKQAVYRWWRYVTGSQFKSNCMRALLSQTTYCKAVNLVNKYDPHANCPSEGGTNATCWVNRDWERDPLLLPHEEGDWFQSCELSK